MVQRFGKLDILVNNAGIVARGTLEDTTSAEWDQVMDVNAKGVFLGTKAAIAEMRQTGGSIINIASVAGLRAHQSTPYTASKAAVIGLTFSMAADHGSNNIRVNCIAPGLVYTPMVAPRMDEQLRGERRDATPLGTEGTAWDIAWALSLIHI